MRILTISDEESAALWDHFRPERLNGIDLIISCGDLKANYLSFLVTMAKCPVLYVHGNHDTSYSRKPPEGCDCIDGHIVEYNGLRIGGLGGCRRYHPGEHQYSEREMRRRIRYLLPPWRRKRLDILVTHAPPRGHGDAEDIAHWGFEAFLPLLEKHKPRYLLHGHVHARYGAHLERVRTLGETTLVNCCERYILEIPDVPYPLERHCQIRWITRHKE